MAAKRTTTRLKTAKTKPQRKLTGSSHRAQLAGLADDDEEVPNLMVTIRLKRRGMKGKKGRRQLWHRDKLVSYVCEKIADGRLVVDVLRKIGIKYSKWNEIVNSTDTYKALYAQARKLEAEQMRIYAQKVAEGRDWITRREKKRIEAFRKKNKKNIHTGSIVASRENNILGRNRLQLDAAKWIAKVTDPERFGDKAQVSVGGNPSGAPMALTLRFVDANGKEIAT